ncbi:MAG TPA: ABC transporter permease [Firmicutes bacterium]|nr:ABC transporter permease [Bacillota bacterium]
MKIRTWGYLLREGWEGIRSGKLMAIASISTVAVSMLVLGLFLAVVLNLGRLMHDVESEVQIRAFLTNAVKAESIPALEQEIKGLPGVTVVRFVSREEALERMRNSMPNGAAVLEAVEEMNPLPDSFEVQVARPEQVSGVATAISALPGVQQVDYKRDTVDRLFRLTAIARGLGLAVGVLLVIGSAVVISNAIRLTVFARRREVAIMKLVGATDWFIRLPFMLEGLSMGLFGSVLAVGLLAGTYWWAAGAAARVLPFLPVLDPRQVVTDMAPALLALGVLVGALGSGASLRRFLHV